MNEHSHRITANQLFYLLGLDNTSPTFASAIQNSVPAITFLMAVILRQQLTLLLFPINAPHHSFSTINSFNFRIEKVRLDRKDGISKVAGLLFCVAGASVITLFKGPTIYSPSSASKLQLLTAPPVVLGDGAGKSWTLGCIYLIGHCLSWSAWLVLQAPILKRYPARLSFTSYQCFFGILQFLLIAAFFERNGQAWLIRNGSEVFSVFYAVCSSSFLTCLYIYIYMVFHFLYRDVARVYLWFYQIETLFG